ncbi:MAG: choice-of-anchor J domain-containing protein [Muribaculaceae bacterium]|nr:choice-of-anchor J domain-containing protein [Muribaculaceae bacterium]
MTHLNRLISGLAIVTVSAATIPVAYAGFKKMKSGGIRSTESAVSITPSPVKYKAPALSSPTDNLPEDGTIVLRGMVINTDTPYIVEFSPSDHISVKNIHSFDDFWYDDFEPSGCAFMGDGKFYISSMYSPYMGAVETAQKIYDAETWELISERNQLNQSSSALSIIYDPLTCAAYGYFQNDDNDTAWFMYGRMNMATGDVLGINSVDDYQRILAIAASPDGNLYGVNCNGVYCRINKATGELTKLGHTDVKPEYMQSAVIDPQTGIFYWAAMTDEGEAGLYTVDPVTYQASLVSLFPNNQEIVGLHIVREKNDSQAPAAVEDAALSFERDNLNGTVTFTAPDHTVNGNTLAGKLKAHASLDGNHWEKDITPGSKCELDISAKYNGLYNITLWVSADDVEGVKTNLQKWIGEDYPQAVTGINCSVDGTKVTLSWNPVSESGQHGGYVNPEETTYIITTDGYDQPWIRDYDGTSYVFEFPEGTTADLKFGIRPVFREIAGPYAYSETVSIGSSVYEVPCELSPYGDFNKFLIVDADSDGDTWAQDLLSVTCAGQDDWIMSPMIHFEAGQLYEINYSASAKMGVISPEIIEVKAGMGDTPDDMSIDIDSQTITTYGISKFNDYSASFMVDKSGDYRIGFHCASINGDLLGLGGFEITTLANTDGPAAPADAAITPAPAGELKADITFTAPTKTISGETLDALSKAEVYRGSTLVGTVENPVPGQTYTITDGNASQGFNIYDIRSYTTDGVCGLSASIKGWVGIDIPHTPDNVVLKYKDDTLILSWDMDETGVNGGYVNLDDINYLIVEPEYMTILTTVEGVTNVELPLGGLEYQFATAVGVVATNAIGTTGEAAVSDMVMVGPDLELPFEEHFGAALNHGWIVQGTAMDDLSGWNPVQSEGADGEPGLSDYYGMMSEDAQALVSSRISLKNVSKPSLRFQYKGRTNEEGIGGKLAISVSEELAGEYVPVFTKEFGLQEDWDWKEAVVNLSEYKDKSLFISFAAIPSDKSLSGSLQILLDEISVRDDKDYDLEVNYLKIDRDEVEAGVSEANLDFLVKNHGLKPFGDGDYSIQLYAGERLFSTVEGKTVDSEFGLARFQAVYVPSVDDNDPAVITARLSSDLDQTPDNDISNSVQTYVLKSERPAVNDLTADQDTEGVELHWSKPDLSGQPIRMITDDFETYRDWDVNRAGKWTIIDKDQAPGICVSYFFPGSTGPIGWVVINPGAITEDIGERLKAYSGEKYMAAYSSGLSDNDDWLITPELSGREHQISFMARAESDEQGREMFEVYYSTTAPAVEAMQRLDDIDWRTIPGGWNEFKFTVPDGAKYFAVRCVSHSRVAMHIDDFTYESAAIPLEVVFVGYNIYRDGVKLNDVPVTSESFLDTTPKAEGEMNYTVRVVYDRGESDHSNVATVNVDGVEMIEMDVDPSVVAVYDLQGRRVRNLTEGEIYVTSNRCFLYRKSR